MTEENIIQKTIIKENNDPNLEKLKKWTQKLGESIIPVNRLDYYSNAIPLGAFCNAVSFILHGFQRCNVFRNKDSFLLGVILLFGGIGQITSGILEYIKGRIFTSTFYSLYGFYCLSDYFLYILPLKFYKYGIFGINFDEASLCGFYGAWMMVTFPIIISSIKTNLFYFLQCFALTIIFVLRCFGEGFLSRYPSMKKAAGIFEVIEGFISLYICINQLINEAFRLQILPAYPFQSDNDIDIFFDYRKKNEL